MDGTPRLYDEDFFAWTQDQAARLRAWPAELRPNGLDLDGLAEEIEGLGRSDRREAEAYAALIMEHLLKIGAATSHEPIRHWRAEVNAWRDRLAEVLRDSPSLRRALRERQGVIWARAARRAADLLESFGDMEAAQRVRPQAAQPWELEAEILAPGWFPPHPR